MVIIGILLILSGIYKISCIGYDIDIPIIESVHLDPEKLRTLALGLVLLDGLLCLFGGLILLVI